MKWNNIKITIFKEIRGIVRDKKSLHKLLLYPLLIPAVIFLFGFLFDALTETKYSVGVNYKITEEEKLIIKDLENLKFEYYENEKDIENAYKNKIINGYILKHDNVYTIYTDNSQNSGEIVSTLSSMYLESYNKILGNKYLVENNIEYDKVFNNIVIETKSLTEDELDPLTSVLYSLVITYIAMIVIMTSMVVVTDATSGEKERGTLETILTFPINSSDLVIGKYLATAILSFAAGLISYLLSIPAFVIGIKTFKSYEHLVFNTSPVSVLLVIFVLLLASLLSAGVCMALAGKAKSYKEAQSSLGSVTILPMIPYFLNIMEVESTIFYLFPIANCTFALNDILVNKVDAFSLLLIIVSTAVYIVLIIIYISKQYKKEETLFS